jgi:predicted glycoside hydrolase/deacetylase ChbG (UPF0249 family)
LKPRRLLLVNADDFGYTHDVNRGIVEAHRDGILTATTLMANGAAFEDAIRLARETPALDIGCHLVLVGGTSVLPHSTPLPRTVGELMWTILHKRIQVYEELSAQVRKLLEAGINPSHLDTHKHTHLLPPVVEAVARISEEFGIRWVRRPLGVPVVHRRCLRILERHGCRLTDHFRGYSLTGRLTTKELVDCIRNLPEGTTELMCHPGRCGAELRAAPTRLKESRERELEALTTSETREALHQVQARLMNYRDS